MLPDPGESVGKDPEQSAIAQARVRGRIDRVQKLLNLAVDECRRFAFGARKSLGLDFPGRIHGQHSFFRKPGKHHADGCHVLLDNLARPGILRQCEHVIQLEDVAIAVC
jgi:hypothetical protein